MTKKQGERVYDLEERTAVLGESILRLCHKIKQDVITKPIIQQLVRYGTSVGANYMEANGASSRKDFANKIFICKKEAQETMHWLRMLANCIDTDKDDVRNLWQEAKELSYIFHKIATSTRSRV